MNTFGKTLLLLGSTLTVMAGATISPALPQIYAHFQGQESAELMVRLILTLPALFIALASPFVGMLLDNWGRRPVLLCSLALYGIAGSSAFMVESLTAILCGRALLGIAVAGIMSSITTLIGDYFQGQTLNHMMGLQSAFMAFGGVAFLMMGGIFADIGWQWPFLVYSVALLILPLAYFHLPEPASIRHNIEALVTPPPPYRDIAIIYWLAFWGMAGFYLIPVQLPFYLHHLATISATTIGLMMAASALVTAIVSVGYARIIKQFSLRRILRFAHIVMAAGYLGLVYASSLFHVLLCIALIGIGFGLWMPSLNVWLMKKVPIAIRGKVIGGFTTCFFLGQFFSPIMSQPLIDTFGVASSFLAAALMMGIILIGFAVVERHSKKVKVI